MNQKPVLLLSFRCVALLCCNALLNMMRPLLKQHRQLYIASIAIALLSSCNNQNTNEVKEAPLPSTDSSVFYPVQEYFSNQLAQADTAKKIFYSIIDYNAKQDSAIIDSVKLRELAKPFFEDDINNIAVKKYYRESIFHDASTGSNTFTYTTVKSDLPVQSLDILLDTVTDVVKRIYITKNFTRGDSTITEKMWWKTNEGFSINRILQLPDKKETTQRIDVSWNNN